MRKLFKLFTVVLIISLLFSMMPYFTFASEGEDSISYVDLLVKLGVIGEGDLQKESFVSRAKMAKIACNITNAAVFSYKGMYSDVDYTYAEALAIEAISNIGYMRGYGDGTFMPDKNITVNEAIKTLVSISGYSQKAENLGGYPTGYLAVAYQEGLLEGVNHKSDELIDGKNLATLIKNMLDMPCLDIVSIGEDVEYKKSREHTVLYQYLGYEKGEGVVDANHITSLNNAVYSKEGTVTVDGIRYVDSAETKKLLGMYTEFYYKDYKNTNALNEIVYITPLENEILLLDVDDIISFDLGTYKYYDAKTKKEKTAKLASGYRVIYNARAIESDFDFVNMIPENGSVKLVCNDSGSSYNIAFVESYTNLIVRSVDVSSKIIYGKTENESVIDLKKNSENEAVLKDTFGNEVALDKLSENDVVSIIKTGTHAEYVVSKTKISGSVSEILYAMDKPVYKISDDEYTLASSFETSKYVAPEQNAKDAILVGDNGSYSIDFMGHIAYFDYKTSSAGDKVGFLIDAYRDVETAKKPLVLKMLTQDGEILLLKADEDKFKYCGHPVDKDEAIPYYDVVAYNVNSKGDVTSVDVSVPLTPDYSYAKLYTKYDTKSTKVVYRSKPKSFFGNAAISSDTVVFFVPDENEENHKKYLDDDSYFNIGDSTSLYDNTAYKVKLYNEDPERLTCKYALIKGVSGGGSSITEETAFSVVNKVTRALNKKGDETYLISLYSGGQLISLPLESDSLINAKIGAKTVKIAEGDIIRYGTNAFGEINSIVLNYHVATKDFASAGESKYDARLFVDMGDVYDVENMTFTIKNETGAEVYYSLDGAVIYVYDPAIKNAPKVSIGKYTDVLSYKDVTDMCSKVFIHMRGSSPRTVVIYKKG